VLLPDRLGLGVNDVRRTDPCLAVDEGNCNVELANAGVAPVAEVATEFESTGVGIDAVAGGDNGETRLPDDMAPTPKAVCVNPISHGLPTHHIV
jgi:hypothetical protein